MRKTKKKFNPVITKVKLTPEQAILACACFNTGQFSGGDTQGEFEVLACKVDPKRVNWFVWTGPGATSS
ncbi:MAG: hypothetical protein JW946_01440 [Candidatus Omnitrophica bacterium]|nr:hypothetical protein [Candidatus Omnitrophota bacterium]